MAAGYWTMDNVDNAVKFIVTYQEQQKYIKFVIHAWPILIKVGKEVKVGLHCLMRFDMI